MDVCLFLGIKILLSWIVVLILPFYTSRINVFIFGNLFDYSHLLFLLYLENELYQWCLLTFGAHCIYIYVYECMFLLVVPVDWLSIHHLLNLDCVPLEFHLILWQCKNFSLSSTLQIYKPFYPSMTTFYICSHYEYCLFHAVAINHCDKFIRIWFKLHLNNWLLL